MPRPHSPFHVIDIVVLVRTGDRIKIQEHLVVMDTGGVGRGRGVDGEREGGRGGVDGWEGDGATTGVGTAYKIQY